LNLRAQRPDHHLKAINVECKTEKRGYIQRAPWDKRKVQRRTGFVMGPIPPEGRCKKVVRNISTATIITSEGETPWGGVFKEL